MFRTGFSFLRGSERKVVGKTKKEGGVGSGTGRIQAPGPTTKPDPFAGMAALVITFLFCLVVGGLVAIPLWIDGFLIDPIASIVDWTRTFFSWLVIVGGLRLLWWIGVLRRPIGFEFRVLFVMSGSILGSVVTLGILSSIYSWGKLMVPFFNHAVFDRQLQDLTVWLHFGVDPNWFLVTLFSDTPMAERFLDFIYGLYLPFVLLSTAWYLTSPEPATRHRYLRGFVLVWSSGLALYWLVPALGPVFVFEDLASVVSVHYPVAASSQYLLITNYQKVLEVLRGVPVPVFPLFGVAAMPSLHCALPTFVYLFSVERSEWTRYVILPFLMLTIVASVATGWHYAIDSYVGVALGWICWLAVRRPRGCQGTRP
ncbi:MAG: hypothetical protein DRJ61_13305 [Acidobacteria bacterium]|nr:MAG: hypothetical protein DRJ61_13305 [Acidobacteriota bacterium]